MFVFERDGKRTYGRLGDFSIDARGALVDGQGRSVVGVIGPSSQPDANRLVPIRIDLSKRYTGYSIDEGGTLSALADGKRDTLGRLVLAVFPASERMARADDTSVVATPGAGAPRFYSPGDANVGVLAPHALENSLVDIGGDLARVWRLRRRGELAAAQAGASDECVRDALGLVK
jgi:flagellar hook protein FlgE